jgi:hypothetical protein
LDCWTQANGSDWLLLMSGVTSVTAPRLGELLGRLGDERPPLYAALAGRLRLLVVDGRSRSAPGCRPSATWLPCCTSAGPR